MPRLDLYIFRIARRAGLKLIRRFLKRSIQGTADLPA